MLNIKNLKLAYGSKVLLENANIQIYKGQKVGLVGQNGAGKTSLFKLILGKLLPDSGEFSLSNNTIIAYVEQEIHDMEQNLVDYVLSIHPLIMGEYTDLPEYYQLRPNAEKLLINLGFKLEELYQPIRDFSGGWQMRVNLAKALFVPSDLLLLDEPTNHLDLETVIWLEDWLKKYPGLALIISHDREFLDNVTTHTVALSNKTLTLYGGNYSTYEKTRYQQIILQQQMIAKQQSRVQHLQKFVDKFSAGTRAKQAQSRVKMIEKIQIAEALPKDVEFSIEFLEPVYNIDKLLSITNATIGYPTKTLINNVQLDIFQNSRIGLLGKNGIGKSTFIKALIERTTLLSGNLDINNKIQIGYFAQNTIDQLDMGDTPFSFLSREHKDKKEHELRAYLGRYGFSGDKIKETIGNFSGGEKARLTIANIILHRPNILFLDEPTNHLDMQMREELANGIQDFNGSVIIVSHDKFLLQSVVDKFYLINEQQLKPFSGDLEDYHQFLLAETEKDKQIAKKSVVIEVKKPIAKSNPIKINSEIEKTEQQIDRNHNKKNELETQLATANLNKANKNLTQLNEEYERIQTKIAKLEQKWLELNEQLAEHQN